MVSTCRFSSDRSAAARMCSADSGWSFSPGLALVATTIRSRSPRSAIQRPRICSETPLPYISAVSTNGDWVLGTASWKRSSSAKDVGSSAVHPNTLPPRQPGREVERLDALVGDHHDLAVLDVAHEARPDDVEGAGLGGQDVAALELAQHQRPDPER